MICPTQYGKSLTVALALLTVSVAKKERFTVLAPSEKKAKIIMDYVVDHLFDNYLFYSQLELDENISLDRLRRERSRNHLTFKRGGGIQILTLDSRNSRRCIEAAMGFGGNRIILDESSLIDDPLYSTVKRMLGGYKYADTFMFEIGNPFYRNHFLRTWQSERYHRIFIDYKQGLEEGRYSPEFIEEMREEAFFDVFYECKFPAEDEIDARGFRLLLKDDDINAAIVESGDLSGRLKLGCDIGRGGDESVFVIRSDKVAKVISRNQSSDLMTQVQEIKKLIETFKIESSDVFIDDTGVGGGVTDRLKELGFAVKGVRVGESAINDKFANIKAEMNWNCRVWILGGGKIIRNDGFNQLRVLKYKENSSGKVIMESKEELSKQGIHSPDVADAFILTFAPSEALPQIRII